jgi:hypothetical protein
VGIILQRVNRAYLIRTGMHLGMRYEMGKVMEVTKRMILFNSWIKFPMLVFEGAIVMPKVRTTMRLGMGKGVRVSFSLHVAMKSHRILVVVAMAMAKLLAS